jgi:hypothetical protein
MYWQHMPLPYRGLLLRVGSNIQLLGSGAEVGLQGISLGLRSTKRKGALNSAPCEATLLRRGYTDDDNHPATTDWTITCNSVARSWAAAQVARLASRDSCTDAMRTVNPISADATAAAHASLSEHANTKRVVTMCARLRTSYKKIVSFLASYWGSRQALCIPPTPPPPPPAARVLPRAQGQPCALCEAQGTKSKHEGGDNAGGMKPKTAWDVFLT